MEFRTPHGGAVPTCACALGGAESSTNRLRNFGQSSHVENVTVVSGSLWVGIGDAMGQMKELKAGSFVQVPAKLHHYAAAKVDTVIDISGIGPETLNMLKP